MHEIGPRNFPDRAQWGDGPWLNEHDLEVWTDTTTGYFCELERSPSGGHLCGYVGVEEKHPLYGKDWLSESVRQLNVRRDGVTITFTSDEPKLHWFGFDCGRYGDVSPADRGMGMGHIKGSTYVTWNEAREEVLNLALQLQKYADK